MNIEQTLDDIKDMCLNYMKEGEELPPMLFLLKEGKVLVVDLSPIPKAQAPNAIKDVTDNIQPDAVIIATENWMVVRDLGGDAIDLSNISIRPSQEPDRMECLVISAKTPEQSYSRMYKIIREGNKVELDKVERSVQMSNRFLDGVFVNMQKAH